MENNSDKQTDIPRIAHEPAFSGSVLVVDDMQVNLYIAEKLLTSFHLNVDIADNGFTVLENTKNGINYDIIFMDHKMPMMDGVETTQKLRGAGYKGVIVALTADVPTADIEKDFIQFGFDAYLSKPIDSAQLKALLIRFLGGGHAGINQAGTPKAAAPLTPKLLRIFRSDAENAIATLRETAVAGNIKRYTITIHAMRTMLASLGENKAAEQAHMLEMAGTNNNIGYITNNTDGFIKTVESLILQLCPPDLSLHDDDDDDIIEPIGQLKLGDNSDNSSSPARAKTFLLIDDSKFMRRTIREILVRNGYPVIGEAGNGAAGFEKYKELMPDFVTLDHNMDEKTGLEALELIVAYKPDANVIMISGMMGQGVVAREAIEKGAKAVIEKPVDEKALLRTIERILAQ